MDDMFSEKKLPRKAVMAIRVIEKIVHRMDELVKCDDNDEKFLLTYTTEEAVKAFEGKGAYGMNVRRAYLPPVYRHLIVQVANNLKDPVPQVQKFTNNKRWMKMLDEAWNGTVASSIAEAAKLKKDKG